MCQSLLTSMVPRPTPQVPAMLRSQCVSVSTHLTGAQVYTGASYAEEPVGVGLGEGHKCLQVAGICSCLKSKLPFPYGKLKRGQAFCFFWFPFCTRTQNF